MPKPLAKARTSMSADELKVSFAQAFATYKQYLGADALLSAYVVAFSIFEDRLTASTMLAADFARTGRPNGSSQLSGKLKYLVDRGVLDANKADEWAQPRSVIRCFTVQCSPSALSQ